MRTRWISLWVLMGALALYLAPNSISEDAGEPPPGADRCASAPTTCEEAWAELHPSLPEHQPYLRPVRDPFPPPGEESTCQDCCWTWDDDRHLFEEARPGWVRYTNGRFGFSVEVPESWYRTCPPINGDGQSFASPDGLIRLTFYGFVNIHDGTNPHGLATLEEYVALRERADGVRDADYVVLDGWSGFETVASEPYQASSLCPVVEGCYVVRWITLLDLREGRGIVFRAATPVFREGSVLLDEILITYRAQAAGR